MSPLQGPRDLSGAAGPHPRAGLHPTVPPQGLAPRVGAHDAAGLGLTTLATSTGKAVSRSTRPSPPTPPPRQLHRLRVGHFPCSGRPRLSARASIKAKNWTYAQAWASSPRRAGRSSRIRAGRSRSGVTKAKETMRKEMRFLADEVNAKNLQEPGIVVVREFLVAASFARTPTTPGSGAVGARGVGVADFTLAPGYASTSTPPDASTKPLTSCGTTARGGDAGVARRMLPSRFQMRTPATPQEDTHVGGRWTRGGWRGRRGCGGAAGRERWRGCSGHMVTGFTHLSHGGVALTHHRSTARVGTTQAAVHTRSYILTWPPAHLSWHAKYVLTH